MLNFLILIILLCLFKKWFLQALKYLVVNGAWYLKYLIFKKNAYTDREKIRKQMEKIINGW